MRIILDTNVYVSDYWMRGADFQSLLDNLSATVNRLLVPEIVFEEVCQKYREQLVSARSDLGKAQSSLARLAPKVKVPQLDVDSLASAFRSAFRDTLDIAEAKYISYPLGSHDAMARRAIEKRHPFNEKGAGYRDALVWEAVIRTAGVGGGDVALVTQDVGDFFRKVGDGGVELHPDLATEARGITRSRIVPFHTLAKFVSSEVQPRLEELGSVRAAIQQNGRVGKLDLRSALLQKLKEELENRPVDPGWLGFPSGAHVVVSEMQRVGNVDVSDARRLSDGRLVLNFNAGAEVQFSVLVPDRPPIESATVEDYYDVSSSPFRPDEDNREGGALTVRGRVLINRARSRISSLQIRAIDPAA